MKHRIWKLTMAAMTLSVAIAAFAGSAQAAQKDESWARNAEKIAKKTGTERVETIHWSAKLKINVQATVTENKKQKDSAVGKKIKIKKNTSLTIYQRDYHEKKGVSQCMLKNGRVVYIPNKYLKITKPICSGKKDYTTATKEAYVNNQKITSNDQYMIWVSLSKQRVNVFRGSNHNWKLINCWKCSTGKADAPTLDQSFKKNYVIQWKKKEVDGLYWYSAVYGSGFHKFPGGGQSSALGIKPISHSCIRLSQNYAKWIFNNMKNAKEHGASKATRVFIW